MVDIIQALTQQPDFQAARNYWKVLKNRLKKEGSESVTKCNRPKLEAADGKKYLTDTAKKLSLEAKRQLETSRLNNKTIERAAGIIKLRVVDGSRYGF